MKKINWLDHFIGFTGVLIGVFLAFQIGTWSDQAKEKEELKAIVISLIDELERDIKAYEEEQIPDNTKQAEGFGMLVESILADEIKSVRDQFSMTFEVLNYAPNKTTYASVISSGKLNLFKDLEMRKAISYYYDNIVVEAEKRGENQIEFFGQIIPWLIEGTNLLDIEDEDIIGDVGLANNLYIYQSLIGNKVRQYTLVTQEAKALKAILEKLLEEL